MLYVIETYDDVLIGAVEFVEGGVLVRNGFVGGPMKVEAEDLVRIEILDEDGFVESMVDINYIKVG